MNPNDTQLHSTKGNPGLTPLALYRPSTPDPRPEVPQKAQSISLPRRQRANDVDKRLLDTITYTKPLTMDGCKK